MLRELAFVNASFGFQNVSAWDVVSVKPTVQPSQQICVDNSEVAAQVLPKWDMVVSTLHLLTDPFTGLLLGDEKTRLSLEYHFLGVRGKWLPRP